MLKIILLVTFLATANAYLSHGPTIISPPNYGHYAGNYGGYSHPPVVPVAHSYNHVTAVAPYAHAKTIAPAPIVNPYPAASRHAINTNYHQSGYAHSGYSHAAPTSSYIPPPVISPPTVTYNHNVIPPSVQTVNHPTPAAIHYPHQDSAINYHARYSVPYSHTYPHGPMYQNHVNYGW